MSRFAAIIESVRLQKRRITPARSAVIEAFACARSPLSAHDIASSLKKSRVKADKTTVYREIEFLLDQGFLRELQFDERAKRYEVVSGEHTHHLICTNCKNVEAAVLDHDLDEVEKRLWSRNKFEVQHHSLEFYGLCRSCQ